MPASGSGPQWTAAAMATGRSCRTSGIPGAAGNVIVTTKVVTSSGESRIIVRTERNLTTGMLDTASVLVETVVSNIDSVTAAHIHAGAAGVAGPVMVFLTPTYALVNGQRVARTPPANTTLLNGVLSYVAITRATAFSAPYTYDSLLARINAGSAYVNVHTRANPSGEIRGQIQ